MKILLPGLDPGSVIATRGISAHQPQMGAILEAEEDRGKVILGELGGRVAAVNQHGLTSSKAAHRPPKGLPTLASKLCS